MTLRNFGKVVIAVELFLAAMVVGLTVFMWPHIGPWFLLVSVPAVAVLLFFAYDIFRRMQSLVV